LIHLRDDEHANERHGAEKADPLIELARVAFSILAGHGAIPLSAKMRED
jgi:hypothetical protein